MKKFFTLFLLMLLPVATMWGYKKQTIYLTHNGKQRSMLVYTPDTLPKNVPLFITCHGMGGNSENQAEHDLMYEMVDTAKFVMCYPKADGDYWDVGTNDMNFIIKVIDECASRFKINRNRVYWSGFSMGSMLLTHCIPYMQDKIAAFAPTSGWQFGESPWTNCTKKVNIIECIATNDNAFVKSKYDVRGYIVNFANLNKYTKNVVTKGYKTANGTSWFDGERELWINEDTGHEVVLYRYNYSGNGSHTPVAENSHEIWNFCKRFQLGPNIIVGPTLEEATASFNEAFTAANEVYESTAADIYSTAEPLRTAVKEQIDKYKGFESSDSSAYLPPTRKLEEATNALKVRKTNLDNYYSARERIKALIEEYADNAACNTKPNYLRMVTLYSFYNLSQQNMTNDGKLETAAKTLNDTADMFESEVDIYTSIMSIRMSDDSSAGYDALGRRSTGNGLRIINGRKIYIK